MGCIHVLPAVVADQIAAGEVVERPASVVKELVENALDAGAKTISVELEDGGRALIRVSDDGCGMDRDDAVRAMDRHATSKIRSSAELIGVATYGFRGEALPAIASVSRFVLETAAADGGEEDSGTRVVIKGGRTESVEPVARTQGTSVTVRGLFFNTPARRKFLRSTRSETRAAVEAITVLALARLDVSFSLTHDGRVLVDSPRASSIVDRITSLFGRKTAEGLIPVDWGDATLSIRGLVERPAEAKASGRKAYLFVNGRPFKDPFLVRAAEAGYRATIPPGARPSVFLAIGLPGDRVDVNVHPTKLQVRFRDRMFVERAVEEAIRTALRPMGAAALMGAPHSRWDHAVQGAPPYGPGDVAHDDMTHPEPSGPRGEAVLGTLFARMDAGGPFPAERGQRPLLQAFNTYILFESDDGVAIVDQHSAHERVLYERAMEQLRGDGGTAQRLLLPLTLELQPDELEAVADHRELLGAVGFEVDEFGGRSVVIHAVPNPHPRFDARKCFEELVADLTTGRLEGLNRLERFAATYACRAAVMAGQPMDHQEMRELLARLFACELPPHDVHGRPTIVQLPRTELEKRFGRS